MATERRSEKKRARLRAVRFKWCKTVDPPAEMAAMDVLGRLAAGIAHEVRNPLTTVKGFLDILPDVSVDRRSTCLQLMRDEIEHIEYIVDNLLILAKPEAGSARSENLRDLLTDAVRLVRAQAQQSHVRLRVESESGEVRIECVGVRIRHVFAHLIQNAVESTKNGGEVRVCLWRKEGQAFIRIVDRGDGMEEHVMQRLGEPFFSTKEGGAGLGIVICRRILAEYGGTLAFSSAPGAGTAVTVILPCERVAEPV
jgi:signal transduction histidine kinase